MIYVENQFLKKMTDVSRNFGILFVYISYMIKYIYNYEINQVYKSAIVSNIVACNIDCFFFQILSRPDLSTCTTRGSQTLSLVPLWKWKKGFSMGWLSQNFGSKDLVARGLAIYWYDIIIMIWDHISSEILDIISFKGCHYKSNFLNVPDCSSCLNICRYRLNYYIHITDDCFYHWTQCVNI